MPFINEIQKVLVIGSGPIVIGQAAEFDYAGTQACLALKEEGIEVVLVNNNPATIMTDSDIADQVYMEPLTVECLEKIIIMEKPDGIIGTLGGQTALNLIVELYQKGILEKNNVQVLGTSVKSIQQGEDREKFRKLMMELNEPIPESQIVHTFEEGIQFVKEIGYPIIIRPAYTLGGEGGGFAHNDQELESLLVNGLNLSPIHQVLVEKSIKGWKEVEYEVMRDDNDTCIIVCNMENLDPVGVHTGDSIVVAPSQTLTDRQYQILRNASLKIIRSLKIVGGCNIQFAMDPQSDNYYIIEVNPRVSRSSALASKATGYPIARIAAKCAIGYHLDEIKNPITGSTFASFEPALDYVVVKLPRFPFDKFPEADTNLSTQMKATGEVLAIDRTFEGALNKGLRSMEIKVHGITHPIMDKMSEEARTELLREPTHMRLFAITHALMKGLSVRSIHEVTSIDEWFLNKLLQMVLLEEQISDKTLATVSHHLLKKAKSQNISNERLCVLLGCTNEELIELLKENQVKPSYKLVDTCAAEFEAITPYYYSTYNGSDEVIVSKNKKALVIGSGPIRIGQGIEFDYCSVHAVKALKKAGYDTIVVNNNPETVSTDFSIADKLYFEPITVEDILPIIHKENVDLVFIQFGGQTAINLAEGLVREGVIIAGTSMGSIDQLEDRAHFYNLLETEGIPHIEGKMVDQPHQLMAAAEDIGFPVLVRPSYVIGGQSMYTLYNEEELDEFIHMHESDDSLWPLLVDSFIPGLECELDVISDGEEVFIPAIFEHIEKAGVHSGDSLAIFPPLSLTKHMKDKLVDYTQRICKKAQIIGIANIQFVLSGDSIYVLEVNPRASRTVPIVSKVTDVPMIEMAVRAQLGEKLTQIGLKEEPGFWTVKAPVFSASKLKDVDHVLGPEMKSTGEIIGMGMTVEEALNKALFAGKKSPFTKSGEQKSVFCSIADREKQQALTLLAELQKKCIKLYATEGTAAYLRKHGIAVTTVLKEEIDSTLKKQSLAAAIIIPTKGRDQSREGAFYRALCTKHGIKTFTCLETAQQANLLDQPIAQNYQTIKNYLKNSKREVEYLCKVY
ncbi:carbamoyl-phosphate synthase (glutamine-hydrolyzing) large subunit [Sutcliffiella horikoshii]|uniref:carbamoyl-phosphate synthase (glutamine-hydrolyzing) large subunit n=1 Tax=Sutcliffiella horikoshii TaxID=79883 RepID=UPI001EEDF6B0|nr:carbamoyl-phosphate synthase (glutamine-hydrolyzing) large subunit [Sutcliffiella horikoshii]MCG1020932.1 carbamoyl-phosphate synthase (glutamine-hydrolyzing) large subunit [Sutcliffiella horikoshii]